MDGASADVSCSVNVPFASISRSRWIVVSWANVKLARLSVATPSASSSVPRLRTVLAGSVTDSTFVVPSVRPRTILSSSSCDCELTRTSIPRAASSSSEKV